MGCWKRYLLSRKVTNKARWAFENLLPPIVSDARWFNKILAYLTYGDLPFDLDFKERAPFMTQQEFVAAYEALGTGINRPYDSTRRQRKFLIDMTCGPHVLEVGCGDGQLALEIASRGFQVWGCDVCSHPLVVAQQRAAKVGICAKFVAADVTLLPWKDNFFDSVVTAHTLEHIINLSAAMAEVRRVAKRRIVIVVPCQRYKRYTIDYHLNFFPTEAQLRSQLGLANAHVRKIDGDWGIAADLHAESVSP